MKKRVNTYLAIAITTYCNYQCFYCKKGGESISKERETISFDDVKDYCQCLCKWNSKF